MSEVIETHSPPAFLKRYTRPGEIEAGILKEDFKRFFIVRVEEMFQAMRLPVPPTKATIHTIIYLTEGTATMHIGTDIHTIRAHECFVVQAGQVFSFSSPDVNRGYLCSFRDDFLIGRLFNSVLSREFSVLQIWSHPVLKLGKKAAWFVEQSMKRLLSEYEDSGLSRTDILQPYLMALLAELNRSSISVEPVATDRAAELTRAFQAALLVNLSQTHRVADYAEMLHVTPNHLNKSVRKTTGKSAVNWILESVVLESMVLLSQTAQPVSEIAASLGILDPSHFGRIFKKYAGVTPMEYRRMIEMSQQ